MIEHINPYKKGGSDSPYKRDGETTMTRFTNNNGILLPKKTKENRRLDYYQFDTCYLDEVIKLLREIDEDNKSELVAVIRLENPPRSGICLYKYIVHYKANEEIGIEVRC